MTAVLCDIPAVAFSQAYRKNAFNDTIRFAERGPLKAEIIERVLLT